MKKGDIKHTPEKLSIIAEEIEEFLIAPLEAIKKVKEFGAEWKAPGSWKLLKSR